MNKQYFVWNRAHGAPTFAHDTRSSAETEAKRLAAANPGQEFLIIGTIAVAVVNPQPVTVTEVDVTEEQRLEHRAKVRAAMRAKYPHYPYRF